MYGVYSLRIIYIHRKRDTTAGKRGAAFFPFSFSYLKVCFFRLSLLYSFYIYTLRFSWMRYVDSSPRPHRILFPHTNRYLKSPSENPKTNQIAISEIFCLGSLVSLSQDPLSIYWYIIKSALLDFSSPSLPSSSIYVSIFFCIRHRRARLDRSLVSFLTPVSSIRPYVQAMYIHIYINIDRRRI